MANILFFVLHQAGAFNATWKLAHDLEEAGHRVAYAGLADSREEVTRNGFPYTALFEDVFPPGFVSTLDHYAHSRLQWLRDLAETPRQYLIFERFLAHLAAGGDRPFIALLETAKIDFVIHVGVPYVEWMAIVAATRGVGGAYLRADFSTLRGTGSPPVDCDLIPRHENSLLRSLRIEFSWLRSRLRCGWAFLGAARLTERFAAHYGLRANAIETSYEKNVSFPLPELIPFHPAFEFSPIEIPDRHYIGPSLDLRRTSIPFDWAWLDGRPLVYCALGTYLWRTQAAYRRFFRTLLEAAASMPERQFVLATGAAVAPSELGPPPGNVAIVAKAPQLELLERAEVAVVHGGANSVKECIWLGAPMVAFPLAGDQIGVTARAVHHGLAIRGNFDKIRAKELREMIVAAATSPYLRAQLRLMRGRFLDMEREKRGLRIVETLLPGEDRRSAACRADAI